MGLGFGICVFRIALRKDILRDPGRLRDHNCWHYGDHNFGLFELLFRKLLLVWGFRLSVQRFQETLVDKFGAERSSPTIAQKLQGNKTIIS